LPWLLGFLAGVVIIAAASAVGWWFMPSAVGVAAGFANRAGGWRWRVAIPAVAMMAAAGWAAALWTAVLRGTPYGGVARVSSGLMGLPGHRVLGMALTLLIAVVQAVTGYWLGRALIPRLADVLFR
jgi:hypothetical protein